MARNDNDICAYSWPNGRCGHERAIHHFDESDQSGYCDRCFRDPDREDHAYHVFDEGG